MGDTVPHEDIDINSNRLYELRDLPESVDVSSSFAKRVREIRDLRGLSQRQLATRAGIQQGYLSLLESGQRGEHPRADTVENLAHALGVHSKWLLSGAGPRDVIGWVFVPPEKRRVRGKKAGASLENILAYPTNRTTWARSAVAIAREHAAMLEADPGYAYWVRYLDLATDRVQALLLPDVPKLFDETPSESGISEKSSSSSNPPGKKRSA